MTCICISKLTITGSNNALLPGQCQVIIWTNAAILLTGPLGTNFSEILITIYTYLLTKMHFKMLSTKWWPFWVGLTAWTAGKATADGSMVPITSHNKNQSYFHCFSKQNSSPDLILNDLPYCTNVLFTIFHHTCILSIHFCNCNTIHGSLSSC